MSFGTGSGTWGARTWGAGAWGGSGWIFVGQLLTPRRRAILPPRPTEDTLELRARQLELVVRERVVHARRP